VRHFFYSEAKLATLKFLSLKKNPGFGRFSRSSFEWRFSFFLNRSVEQKTGNMVA
jgi:hypothetical protein